ncbi:MAG: response regulator [Candidatus Omnitrophica bacterium]|nr:response regulator [Candidatus Omnitrophota bacterium]
MAQPQQRILLVDDDTSMQKLYTKRLEVAGYAVSVAADGEEALAKTATDHPDLIILDIMLPKLNGYEVCAHLKKNPATKQLPVVMLTAKDQPKDHLAGLMFGADVYLTKDEDDCVLLEQITRLLAPPAAATD